MKTLTIISLLMVCLGLHAQDLNRILDSARSFDDKQKAIEYYLSFQGQISEADQGYFFFHLGSLYYNSGASEDTLVKIYTQSYEIFNAQTLDSMAFEALFDLAIKVRGLGHRKKAGQLFLRAANFAKQTEQPILEGDALNSTGVNFYRQGEYVRALEYYLRANRVYEKVGHPGKIAKSYNNIGIIYKIFNNYDLAIEYYQQSLAIRKEHNIKNQIAPYFNLNDLYHAIEDHRKALEYSKESLKASREYEHKIWEIDVLISLVKDYQYIEEYDSMKLYIDILFEKTKGDESYTASARKFLGIYYIEINEPHLAISSLNEALDVFEKDNSIDQIELINSHLGDAYALLQNYDMAIYHHKYSLKMAIDENFSPMINLAMEKLHPILLAAGKTEEAYTVLDELRLREDSIFSVSKASITGAMEAQMDLVEEENRSKLLLKETEIQSAKITNQRVVILLIGAISIGILLVSILYINQQKTRKKLVEKEKQLISSELAYKNQQLINFAVQITQKNEFIESLNEKMQQHKSDDFKEISEIIQANESITKDREEFENYVQNVYEGFFIKLSDLYPDITSSEKRLAALLRIDLSSKEISTVLNISPKSVDMSRYRLRKKMNLDASANLSEVLQSI